jgi:hypothetical protein
MTHMPLAPLRRLGIEEPSEIDIEAIAQVGDATVIYKPLTGCAARIIGHGDRAIITVNEKASRARQRFSAAHELGHWARDRGTAAFACSSKTFVSQWAAENPERRANRYAADLLLPEFMFRTRAKGRPIVVATAEELAAEFETSVTSSAIRLVELGSFPAMVVCTTLKGRKWFYPGPDVPKTLFPRDVPTSDSLAYDLLRGNALRTEGQDVAAAAWFDGDSAHRYSIHEDSFPVKDFVITLLWWKDEDHLLAITDDL